MAMDAEYLEILRKDREKRQRENKMKVFKRTLGWLILSSFGVGIYVGISLSMPEIYSFPADYTYFGWMISMSRWLVTPFVIGMFLLFFIAIVAFSFFMAWCFNGSWKELWDNSPFGG